MQTELVSCQSYCPRQSRFHIMKTECCQILNSLDRVEMDRGTYSNVVTKFSTSNSIKESSTFITETRAKIVTNVNVLSGALNISLPPRLPDKHRATAVSLLQIH